MNLSFKNVFLSVGMFVFALGVFGLVSNKVEAGATTCTAVATGNWSAAATWDATCNTSDASIPDADDAVVIPGNFIVTVNAAGAVAATVSISDPIATGNNGITIASPGTLAVTGDVTIVGSSSTSNSTIAVADGTLSSDDIFIAGGGSTGNSVVSVSTGTITAADSIIMSGTAARAQLTSTDDSDINIGGNLTGGTLTTSGTGTITFNNATPVGSVTIGPYITYNNVVINKTGRTATAGGTTTIGGTLTVTAGTLALDTSVFTVNGTTTVATGGILTMSTGTKTFTGLVTLNSNTTFGTAGIVAIGAGGLNVAAGVLATDVSELTVTGTTTIASGATINFLSATGLKVFTGNVTNNGTWTEGAVAVQINFAGNLTNNGTFTATPNTAGVHTFGSGAGATTPILSGTTGTIAIPSVRVSGTANLTNASGHTFTVLTLLTIDTANSFTNNGTVNATTSLAGAGTFVNAATGTVNLGGTTFDVTTFTVSAAGNTVNYNKADVQTVRVLGYSNLTLSGGAVKTIPSTLTIAGDLVIAASTVANLATGGASTANGLRFASTFQHGGLWGGAGSAATSKNATYFAGTVTGTVLVATSHSGGSSDTTTTTTCASTYTLVNGVCTATATTTAPVTCTLPQVLNTTTNACVTPEVIITIIPTEVTPGGCSAGNLFNTSTGAACVNNAVIPQGCSGGNAYNTSTGAVCTNNTTLQIPGCGNSTDGFSTATGGSCAGNHVTTTTTYDFGTVTLKNGSKGSAVMELQRFLNDKLSLGLVVDGKLGPKTIAVIKTWQKDNGLVSDGLVGSKTKAEMNK